MALWLIAASLLFGFNLGTLFSMVMVGLAGGYIFNYTSKFCQCFIQAGDALSFGRTHHKTMHNP